MILLIGIDLCTSTNSDRSETLNALEKFIEKNALDMACPLKSQWLVRTPLDWNWWYAELKKLLTEEDDHLFICLIPRNQHVAWVDMSVVAWMDKNLEIDARTHIAGR